MGQNKNPSRFFPRYIMYTRRNFARGHGFPDGIDHLTLWKKISEGRGRPCPLPLNVNGRTFPQGKNIRSVSRAENPSEFVKRILLIFSFRQKSSPFYVSFLLCFKRRTSCFDMNSPLGSYRYRLLFGSFYLKLIRYAAKTAKNILLRDL